MEIGFQPSRCAICSLVPLVISAIISSPTMITIFSAMSACENAVSEARTASKQAEMRLVSAQAELVEKERDSKKSEQAYVKDKAVYNTALKEVDRIEVSLCAIQARMIYCTVTETVLFW